MIIELGGSYFINNEKKFRRNIYIEESERDKYLKEFKFDTFQCIYKYVNNDYDNCDIIGDFYIDLDCDIADEESYNKVKTDALIVINTLTYLYKIDIEDIQIYFSGHKGFHIILDSNLFGIKPNKYLNMYYKVIAQHLKTFTKYKLIDTRIYDRKRLFRIPNTINSKTGLYKIMIDKDKLTNFTRKEMTEYCSSTKDIIKKEYNVSKAAQKLLTLAVQTTHKKETTSKKRRNKNNNNIKLEILPCIKNILETDIEKGNRNNTFAIVSSSLFQSGKTEEEVLNILYTWNDTLTEPLSEREVRTTVTSTYTCFLTDKCYGCQSIKELGYCIEGCSLFKGDN